MPCEAGYIFCKLSFVWSVNGWFHCCCVTFAYAVHAHNKIIASLLFSHRRRCRREDVCVTEVAFVRLNLKITHTKMEKNGNRQRKCCRSLAFESQKTKALAKRMEWMKPQWRGPMKMRSLFTAEVSVVFADPAAALAGWRHNSNHLPAQCVQLKRFFFLPSILIVQFVHTDDWRAHSRSFNYLLYFAGRTSSTSALSASIFRVHGENRKKSRRNERAKKKL